MEYFEKSDLDLGKCDILKHDIKLTDHQSFKERYRRIPPHLFEEVKQHLLEMVEIGAIRKRLVHGPIQWSLLGRKMWALGYVLTCAN